MQETEVNCAVTWIRPPDEDDGWLHLLDAFQAYADSRWKGTIIPANIAAEAAISKAVFDGISIAKVTSKDNLEEFLAKAATYSHQLNVVLPLLARLFGVPLLDAQIRGLLNRLRSLRNKLAHTGTLPHPLTQNDAAELLVAATFGFHYGRLFRRRASSIGSAGAIGDAV